MGRFYPTHFWKWQAGLPDLSESEQTVMEIAKDLCVFFHQESVMVTTVPVRVVFVREQMEYRKKEKPAVVVGFSLRIRLAAPVRSRNGCF